MITNTMAAYGSASLGSCTYQRITTERMLSFWVGLLNSEMVKPPWSSHPFVLKSVCFFYLEVKLLL